MFLARCEPAKSPREARRLATRVMRECASENSVLNWEKEKEKEREGGRAVRRRRKKRVTGRDAAVRPILYFYRRLTDQWTRRGGEGLNLLKILYISLEFSR